MVSREQTISLPYTEQGKKTDDIYPVSSKKLRTHSVNTEQAHKMKTEKGKLSKAR